MEKAVINDFYFCPKWRFAKIIALFQLWCCRFYSFIMFTVLHGTRNKYEQHLCIVIIYSSKLAKFALPSKSLWFYAIACIHLFPANPKGYAKVLQPVKISKSSKMRLNHMSMNRMFRIDKSLESDHTVQRQSNEIIAWGHRILCARIGYLVFEKVKKLQFTSLWIMKRI